MPVRPDGEKRTATLGSARGEIGEGDWISIDGGTGEVFLGRRDITADRLTDEIAELNHLLKRPPAKSGTRRAKRTG